MIESKRQQSRDPALPPIYPVGLGSDASMCTVIVQPYFPREALTTPQEVKSSLRKIQVASRSGAKFPSSNVKTIPDGTLRFHWGEASGEIECEQIYAGGLVYNSADIRYLHEGFKAISIGSIAVHLFMTLKATGKFYQSVGYQGEVTGQLTLQNVEGVKVYCIVPYGWRRPLLFEERARTCLLPEYTWDLELGTSTLSDNKEFQSFYIEKIKEIHWGLDYEVVSDELLEAFLKGEGWLVE